MNFIKDKIIGFINTIKEAILEVSQDENLSGDEKLEKATGIIIERAIMPVIKFIDIPSVPEFAEGIIDKVIESALKAVLPEVVQTVFDLMKNKFFEKKETE